MFNIIQSNKEQMEISINSGEIKTWDGSTLILGVFEGDIEKQLIQLQSQQQSFLAKKLKDNNFKGKTSEICSFNCLESTPNKLILVGLGEPENLLLDDLRKAAATGARASIGNPG